MLRKKIEICNFPVTKDGYSIADYQFTRVSDYNSDDFVKRDKHMVTATAQLKTDISVEKKSILWEGKNSTALMDILLLYNFFYRGTACLKDIMHREPYKVEKGISFYKLSDDYIGKVLACIQNKKWKSTNKKRILALHFFFASRTNASLQILFFEKWLAFDLFDYKNDKEFVDDLCKRIDVKRGKFETIRKFWREIRNCYFHEGTCPYQSFKKQLGKKYKKNGKERNRFSSEEKYFFNAKIATEQKFNAFKGQSVFIMEYILALSFAKIFGVEDACINKGINEKYYIERIKAYFNELAWREDNIPTVKFV